MDKLAGVHPDLVAKIARVRAAMEAIGHPMIVTDGVRTAAQQRARWLQGRNAAGQVVDPAAIVTHADGVVHKSNHQVHADGYGHAVDCAFLVDGRPDWSDTHPWAAYGALGEALGLTWGGHWVTIHDRPHLELP